MMQPSGSDDLASSNKGQFKWKARKEKIINQSENDIEDDIQSKESSKNDKKHSFSGDLKENSDRLESVLLGSEQISKQADQEIKGPLTHEGDVCESDDSLMNPEILTLIEDVEVKSDRLESVPKLSDQISGQANQEIKEPLTDEDDVCESEDSLMNSEILALIEDVEVKSDRLMSVPNLSDQISGEVNQELKEPLTYESDDSLMNSEILALIEDVEVKSDRLVSVPKVSEQISGEVDQEIKQPLICESDDSLMNSEILALIEDVEVGLDGVNKSGDSSMNSEILAMIEDVEVESDGQNKCINQDGTDLTGLKSSKALKVSKRRVSAIRCFPPGCGINAVPLTKEEFEKAIAESKNHCSSCCSTEPEEPFLEDEESEQEDEVEVESDGQNKCINQDGTGLTGLKSSKALKVSKRRVSAIRCFPPGCGINAVPLTKEEFEKAIAESKNHCSSCCSTEPEKPFVEDEESEQEDEGKETKSSERS